MKVYHLMDSVSMPEKEKELSIIGPSALVQIDGYKEEIPAKVDTGAKISAIWASNVTVDEDGELNYTLFDKESPFYTGKTHHTTDYKVTVTRSAMGQEQIRYCTHISVKINGRKIRVLFSLADRSRNSFPILIGKRTITKKYIVDTSLPDVEHEVKPVKQKAIIREFEKNQYEFHKKYMRKGDTK